MSERRTINVYDYQMELAAAYRDGLLAAAAICDQKITEQDGAYRYVSRPMTAEECKAAIERRAKEGT